MFSSRFICVVALCGALLCIEYSNGARADDTTQTSAVEMTPNATLNATPNETPNATPEIDIVAQQLLREMSKTYANLKSFSCVANLSGTAQVPKVNATILWQKPNRFNISRSYFNSSAGNAGKPGVSVRTVSNGREVAQSYSTPRKSERMALPSQIDSLPLALRVSGAGMLLLAGLDSLLPEDANSPSQLTAVRLLPSNGLAGVDVVAANIVIDGEKGELQFAIDRKSHLLKSAKLSYTREGVVTSGTETYSNVRINPALPAVTFALPSLKTATPKVATTQTAMSKTKMSKTAMSKVVVPKTRSFYDARLKVGGAPFAFSGKTLSGQTISLADYRGKVLLLDFWATWCGPCVEELPAIKSAYAKYHARGFEIVGISFDDDRKTLTKFLAQKQIAWPQVFDGKGWDAAVGKIYGVNEIPFALLIGRDGKIAALNLHGAALQSAIKAALLKKINV